MDIVNEILRKSAKNDSKINEITVGKEIELDIDVGTLLASDYNTFDGKSFSSEPEEYIRNLTRDNVQLLINKIWELPSERIEDAIVAKLPVSTFVLPRARRIPKPKPLTKWEQFAKQKGITKKKKGTSKLKWDDVLQKWVPKYGFKRAKAEKQKDWLVELGDDNLPKEDPFSMKASAKREKVAKNELQRLRNLAKAKNIRIPRVGLPSTEHFVSSKKLGTAVTIARVSTASLGKFQNKLPKEKDAKGIAREVPGLKRKHEPPPRNALEEQKRNSTVLDSILRGNNKILRIDDSVPTSSASSAQSSKKKRTGYKKTKGAKKPKGGKGKRDPHTKVGGRKRR